jgi:hypothetical protein
MRYTIIHIPSKVDVRGHSANKIILLIGLIKREVKILYLLRVVLVLILLIREGTLVVLQGEVMVFHSDQRKMLFIF